jgi:uncharacterized protein (TIGR03084 family)
MFQEPLDFRDESLALHALLAAQGDAVFGLETQFKRWTVDDVLLHLHFWNVAADLSLQDTAAFEAFYAPVAETLMRGEPLRSFESAWVGHARGPVLLEVWRAQVLAMTDRFAAADPRKRLAWASLAMSARSSISARLMETWAHGQAIWDTLGLERVDTDRIRHVAVLGVNTFGWSFASRKLPVPPQPPHVRLVAPSGAVWTWNPPSETDLVEGPATAFCQVVAQTRNVADVGLRVVGETARAWMAIAQCFAGPPRRPPAPGKRFRAAEGA